MNQNERAKSRVVTGQPIPEFLPLRILGLHAKLINVEKRIVEKKNHKQENNKKDTQTGRQEETNVHTGRHTPTVDIRTFSSMDALTIIQSTSPCCCLLKKKNLRQVKKKSSLMRRELTISDFTVTFDL